MSTTPIKFDRDFEEAVLASSLVDSEYLKRASRLLDAHHFSTEHHGWIWQQVRDTWVKYAERVSPKLMAAKAKASFKDDDERRAALELAKRLYSMKPAHPRATLDELAGFVRAVTLQAALEESAKSLEKGNVDKAYEAVRYAMRREVKPKDYTRLRWMEEFEGRMLERKHRKEHPEEYKVFPTGLKKLDKLIGGGIQLGELGIVMATTGKGKSIALNNFAFNVALRGHKAAYLSLEMPARQVAQRIDSRFLRMAYNKIKTYDLSPGELRQIDDRVKKMHSRLKGNLDIISMPLRRCDINAVRGALEDMRHEDGFRPDVVIVDSGDHMRGVGKFESYRLEQAEVYWELKTLAEEEGYGVWTSTQAGKEWAEKVATAEAGSESYDKARIADIIISLNTPVKHSRSTRVETDDEDEEEKPKEPVAPKTRGKYMEAFLAKYRDGESRVTIPLDAEFSRMYLGELEEDEEEAA